MDESTEITKEKKEIKRTLTKKEQGALDDRLIDAFRCRDVGRFRDALLQGANVNTSPPFSTNGTSIGPLAFVSLATVHYWWRRSSKSDLGIDGPRDHKTHKKWLSEADEALHWHLFEMCLSHPDLDYKSKFDFTCAEGVMQETTLLHALIKSGEGKAVVALVKRGASIEDPAGQHWLAAGDNQEILRALGRPTPHPSVFPARENVERISWSRDTDGRLTCVIQYPLE